jgi:integrase
MSDLLTLAQARDRLGVSRFIFDRKFRPQLTEYRMGERTVRYQRMELDALLAETVAPQEQEGDGMFNRRTVHDALEHAWRLKWSQAKGSRKKAQLQKVVDAEMGKVRLSSLDYARIEQWVMELQDRDLAPATIGSRISCLRYALDLAVKRGWMKAVPPAPELEASRRKLRWLTEAEERKLLTGCDSLRYQVADVMRDVIVVLLDTGARVGELLKVREDSLFVRGRMTDLEFLDRKGGDDLRVPLTTRACEAVYRLISSPYWQSRIRGSRESAKRLNSSQNWITHRLTEIRDAAKLPDVTAHTLRHTFASRLVQRGVSIYKVQKLLGHSDIRMTERYSHLAPSSLDDAISVLEPDIDKVTRLEDYRK